MARKPVTIGAPQPWPPPPPPPSPPPPSLTPLPSSSDNKSYRDCSQVICSETCPQWCNNFPFPPPRPFFVNSSGDDDDDSSGSRISPLMAALIAVLAAAFLLLFYYTVVSRYCRRRRRRRHRLQISADITSSSDIRIDPMVQDPARPAGLDESFIRQITVFKYRRGDGLVEGTDCAVCLSEFKEGESLRLMPNCEHAFHIPCIDTWLRSHSNCPMCRAGMNPVPPSGSARGDPARSAGVSVAAMQIQRSDDQVLVIREEEGEVIVCHEVAEDGIKRDP